MTKKTNVALIALSMIVSPSWAVNSPLSNTSAPTALPTTSQSKAMGFARQAGSIAGVVQACGQDTTLFTSRVNQALQKLGTSPIDIATSFFVYQKITQEARANEQRLQSIPCSKALQDYSQLPIMQADYEDKVISQLNNRSNDSDK